MVLPDCGGRIYTAEDNKMPVDGGNLKIQVTDWSGSSMSCHHEVVAAAPTVVTTVETFIDRREGTTITRRGTFYGKALRVTRPVVLE